jgi:thioesterase domain-containing protein
VKNNWGGGMLTVTLCLSRRRTTAAVKPPGPIFLAGYSVGGAYAYEVARLLLEDGYQVAWLGIIDCPPPNPVLSEGVWFGLDAMTMVGFTGYLKSMAPNISTKLLEHTAAATREYK